MCRIKSQNLKWTAIKLTAQLDALRFTFGSSFEENLAAATGECAVMAARCLVRADKACPLWGKEELHGKHVFSTGLKPAVKHKPPPPKQAIYKIINHFYPTRN